MVNPEVMRQECEFMLSYFKKIDFGLWLPILFLGTASLAAIASAAPALLAAQAMWLTIGFAFAAVLIMVDFRPLTYHRAVVIVIYCTAIALLILTRFVAPVIRGTRSWLVLGPVQFQTSEFIKIALIITLSYFFAKRHIGIGQMSNVLISLLYGVVPIMLILAQPDMGSAMVIGGLLVGYLFVSGLRMRHTLLGLLVVVILALWGWNNFLATYQKERIIGLFYPERDPLGVNYNVIQSKVAIGSGGWFGKGFKQGTQVRLGFLPEAHNDFIIAAIIEEWGIVGGILVIGAFIFLLIRIGAIGLRAQHNFSRLLCLGAMIVMLLHFMFNIGSAFGLLPVVGVPLPFVSYGGSNLLSNFTLIGIIQSIALRESF